MKIYLLLLVALVGANAFSFDTRKYSYRYDTKMWTLKQKLLYLKK